MVMDIILVQLDGGARPLLGLKDIDTTISY